MSHQSAKHRVTQARTLDAGHLRGLSEAVDTVAAKSHEEAQRELADYLLDQVPAILELAEARNLLKRVWKYCSLIEQFAANGDPECIEIVSAMEAMGETPVRRKSRM